MKKIAEMTAEELSEFCIKITEAYSEASKDAPMPPIYIPLTKGKVALVDYEDAARVLKYKWHASNHTSGGGRPVDRFYALCTRGTKKNGKRKRLRMHRFVLDYWGRKVVDHINGDTLDNRKENLRIVTRSENNQNLRHHRETEPDLPPPMPPRRKP